MKKIFLSGLKAIVFLMINLAVFHLYGYGITNVTRDETDSSGSLKAAIIATGDEILIGQIVDTNSSWIADKFNMFDIEVYEIKSVHDDPEHIMGAIRTAAENVDLIIITGGLGPTIDDLTKPVLCDYFNTKLVFHEPTYEDIKKLIEERGIPMNRFNHDQALVPEGCTVLRNKVGTAPGLWFERDGVIIVALPGVPYEMKHIMENEVLPRLQKKDKIGQIYHKTVLTQGLPESMLSEILESWEDSLPGNIKLAYLPDLMAVRMRLSATGTDENLLKSQVETQIEKLRGVIPDYIFGYNTETLAEVTGRLLAADNRTIAVAEGCTGGYISHLITSAYGSSSYFKGSIVANSEEIRSKFLGISRNESENNVTASEMVARKMAEEIRKSLKSDYGVATSGIINPLDATEQIPAGTVWIAVSGPAGTVSEKISLGDNPERSIIRASQTSLQMLRRIILSDNKELK